MQHMAATLGNKAWVRANEVALKAMLPEDWTDIQTLSALRIGFSLKALGVDWRSENEFGSVMVWLEKIGVLLRQGLMVKRNSNSIFHPVPSQN